MTIPLDYPDFTQRVANIDTAARLDTGGQDVPEYPSTIGYDTSAYSTLVLRIMLPYAATAAQVAVIVQWSEAGTDTIDDVITLVTPVGTPGDFIPYTVTLPVKGSAVALSYVGNPGIPLGVQAYASTRQVAARTSFTPGAPQGRFITTTGNLTVPAKGSIVMGPYLPVASTLGLQVAFNNADMFLYGQALVLDNDSINWVNLGWWPALQSNPTESLPLIALPAPLLATQWQAINNYTSNELVSLTLYDLS